MTRVERILQKELVARRCHELFDADGNVQLFRGDVVDLRGLLIRVIDPSSYALSAEETSVLKRYLNPKKALRDRTKVEDVLAHTAVCDVIAPLLRAVVRGNPEEGTEEHPHCLAFPPRFLGNVTQLTPEQRSHLQWVLLHPPLGARFEIRSTSEEKLKLRQTIAQQLKRKIRERTILHWEQKFFKKSRVGDEVFLFPRRGDKHQPTQLTLFYFFSLVTRESSSSTALTALMEEVDLRLGDVPVRGGISLNAMREIVVPLFANTRLSLRHPE